jgi:4-hydroxy-4-methyl-2-oxoglutarate aldolase
LPFPESVGLTLDHQDTETGAGTISLLSARQVLSVALLCDALDGLGFRHQSPAVSFRALTSKGPQAPLLLGFAKTTLWSDMAHVDPLPYKLELEAVDTCRQDEVIVCAAGGSMRSGIWGELLSTAARNQGCVGVLVDGAVRDVSKMREMGFVAYARGTSPLDSRDRQRVIDLDIPVELGNVIIAPGDLIAADEDGSVVIPKRIYQDVLRAAWHKAHEENRVRDAIRGGMGAVQAFETFGVL